MRDAHWLTPGEKNDSRNFSLVNELKTPRGDGPSQTSVRREHPVEKVSSIALLPAPSMWKERLKIQRKAQNEAPMNLGTGSYLKHTSHK